MRVITILLVGIFLSTGFHSLYSQKTTFVPLQPDSVFHYFDQQLLIYPQEKMYAQIDKPAYIAGEDIWFRAYVVNAAWHTPDTTSRYVYAELINPENRVEQRIKVRVEDKAYAGYIPLSERLPEGEYKLRFYTRFMEGIGEEYFFERNIRIGTLANLESEKKENKRSKKKEEESFDLAFFPEGGALPANIISRVGFKAINTTGLGEDVTGFLISHKGDTITEFRSTHLGMGSFSCVVPAGEKYHVLCRTNDGVEKRFDFPVAEEDVFSLQVSRHKGRLHVKVNHSPEVLLPESLYLMVSCRGNVLYMDEWDCVRNGLSLGEELLLPGVNQLLLMDKMGNPVSERLVFSDQIINPAIPAFSTDKSYYSARQPVDVSVILTDEEGKPLEGDFSISITDDRDVQPDRDVNILSTLLLSSELKGYIESPAFYFNPENNKVSQHLDNLMLTQGWTRCRMSDIIKDGFMLPTVPKEWSMRVTGKLQGGILMNRTAKEYPVTLISMNPFFYLETETNEEGIFCFDNFETPDSITFVVQGKTPKGGSRVEILPDPERFPALLPAIGVREKGDTIAMQEYLKKADNQLLLSKGIRTIQLSDVVVTADRHEQKKGKSAYSSAFNQRFSPEDMGQITYVSIFDLLRRLPGVVVSGESVSFARNQGAEPLIMVDDIMIENDHLAMILVDDVDEIELVKDGGAAFFGGRASNGAILITTKRGEINYKQGESFHIKNVTPLGVQVTKEFYSPAYDVEKNADFINPDLRTTIYWNPAVRTQEDGKAALRFFTAESFKTYSVVIEGITSDGRIVHTHERIQGTIE